MANINSIKTDVEKEDKGVWKEILDSGISLKIARARNSAYRELMRKLTEPRRDEIREEEKKDEAKLDILLDILKEVRAKTILLDWKDLDDADGNPIPYSCEKALEFFKDPELKDLYTFVIVSSEDMDNFKKDLVKESEKN